ncbi:UNKNOWN [Stylonychia lemnae]|uniref:Uncharacterized protein n=1 Tax=Stylonychia lemnae TaxID=5949 RepID=A0A077ZTQ8_STYLE|nr:UNKNOWN [Stylonychia lemnae]|eukprot:CDW72924.1 UNKNOWN [Stylonychia lemnae]
MGNCGGSQKELSLDLYMKSITFISYQFLQSITQLKENLTAIILNSIRSVVDLGLKQEEHEPKEEQSYKIKIKKELMNEGLRIGNKSSLRVYNINQGKRPAVVSASPQARNGNQEQKSVDGGVSRFDNDQNPYDVNLLNPKEAILFSQTVQKFNFNEFTAYTQRHAIITKTAIRIYESKEKAISTYGKPMIAIPLNAVSKVQRTSFDTKEDARLDRVEQKTRDLNKNLFELILKDEFLPIYTHQAYTKVFKDTSVVMEVSPDKRRSSVGAMFRKGAQSPGRTSNTSKMSTSQIGIGQQSPRRFGTQLEMHKKTGVELRESPSKGSKIVMKYINNYQDVGPILPQKAISYNDLVELSKAIDKKETWVRSDLRLIFAIEDSQLVDEAIETLQGIIAE